MLGFAGRASLPLTSRSRLVATLRTTYSNGYEGGLEPHGAAHGALDELRVRGPLNRFSSAAQAPAATQGSVEAGDAHATRAATDFLRCPAGLPFPGGRITGERFWSSAASTRARELTTSRLQVPVVGFFALPTLLSATVFLCKSEALQTLTELQLTLRSQSTRRAGFCTSRWRRRTLPPTTHFHDTFLFCPTRHTVSSK